MKQLGKSGFYGNKIQISIIMRAPVFHFVNCLFGKPKLFTKNFQEWKKTRVVEKLSQPTWLNVHPKQIQEGSVS